MTTRDVVTVTLRPDQIRLLRQFCYHRWSAIEEGLVPGRYDGPPDDEPLIREQQHLADLVHIFNKALETEGEEVSCP